MSKVIDSLQPKKSVDADNLSYLILKNGGQPVIFRLFQMFSVSLETSRIPLSWKTAIVTPIFKKGSKLLVSNYRPVSVTSCCSRILERIVKNKISNFLVTEDKISNSQHGFVAGKSTDTALIKFYDFVTKYVDQGQVVDAIFFDFEKAFDSVPHNLLLSRLHSIGIRNNVLSWLTDFLSNRYQKVKINNSVSSSLPVKSGVIQGSVLGPTLFNIFVDSVDNALQNCHILKYADDTKIFCSAKNSIDDIRTMQGKIQRDISNIFSWTSTSGLRLNIDKCFSISFGRSDVMRNYTISDRPIPCKSLFSDLGVVVQSPFSFKPHLSLIHI